MKIFRKPYFVFLTALLFISAQGMALALDCPCCLPAKAENIQETSGKQNHNCCEKKNSKTEKLQADFSLQAVGISLTEDKASAMAFCQMHCALSATFGSIGVIVPEMANDVSLNIATPVIDILSASSFTEKSNKFLPSGILPISPPLFLLNTAFLI